MKRQLPVLVVHFGLVGSEAQIPSLGLVPDEPRSGRVLLRVSLEKLTGEQLVKKALMLEKIAKATTQIFILE